LNDHDHNIYAQEFDQQLHNNVFGDVDLAPKNTNFDAVIAEVQMNNSSIVAANSVLPDSQ